jgi:hypothetical protein
MILPEPSIKIQNKISFSPLVQKFSYREHAAFHILGHLIVNCCDSSGSIIGAGYDCRGEDAGLWLRTRLRCSVSAAACISKQ